MFSKVIKGEWYVHYSLKAYNLASVSGAAKTSRASMIGADWTLIRQDEGHSCWLSKLWAIHI